MKRTWIHILFLSICTTTFAQDLDISIFKQIKDQYPEEDAVFIDYKDEVNLSLKGGKISVVTKHYEDKILLSNKSDWVDKQTISYTKTFHEINKVKALVLQPEEDKYKVSKIKYIGTRSSYSSSVFYDDNKYKVINFPKLEEGARTVISYEEILKEPRLLSTFFLQNHIPVKNAVLIINYPSTIDFGYTIFNDTSNLVQVEKTSKGKMNQIRIFVKDMDKVKYEGGITSPYYLIHVAMFIKSYKNKAEEVQMLNGVEGLHKWYTSFLDTINTETSPNLKNVVDSIITDQDTEMEKAKKIFYWVQDNIKYVAFEQGLAGFIPMQAKLVCDKKYGDCKGMSSIISEMLEYANLKGHLCWVGTSSKPYKYTDIASPIVDNHMIAAVEIEDSIYFLDATNSYLPFGYPTAHIQGKQVLVDYNQETFKIHEAPIIAKHLNGQHDTVTVTIQGDSLLGEGTTTLLGYAKNQFTYRIIGENGDDKDELIKAWTKKGHNKYKVESYEMKNVNDKDKVTRIEHKFTIPGYVKHWDGETYINLNLHKHLMKLEVEDNRLQDIQFNNLFEENLVVKLKLPEDMDLTSIPENRSYEDKYFMIKTKYELKDSYLILTTNIHINTLQISHKDFDDYQKFIDALRKAYKQSIVLKNKE